MLYSKGDLDAIFLDTDTRIQILDSMSYLPRADKEQCAAFIVRFSHVMTPISAYPDCI